MKLTAFFITLFSLTLSVGVYAADPVTPNTNPSNQVTTPSNEKQKPIESKNASGGAQFTIVDENGNLKVVEDEKAKTVTKPNTTTASQEAAATPNQSPTTTETTKPATAQ